jgi:hypothetical protein
MAIDRMTPSQEDALREVAQKFAAEDHNAETVATHLRLYAIEWNIHYLETDIIQISEEAVEARATAVSTGQPGATGAWTDRKKPDRRQGERRQGERRKVDRRKRDRRRTGFSALAANFLRFGKEERRKGERRTGEERRLGNRRHSTRRLIVRRRKDR